jgi:hypothetical protein
MEESLDVEYFSQQDSNFCGAASAQMLLHYLGMETASIEQQTLFNEIKTFHSKDDFDEALWPGSSPEALMDELNTRFKKNSYELLQSYMTTDLGESLTRAMIWGVHQGYPSIALMNGGAHWVVVNGYETDELPRSVADSSYRINAIWILDPVANDGSMQERAWAHIHIPERHIPYSAWTKDPEYFSPCNINDGFTQSLWNRSRLVIANTHGAARIPLVENRPVEPAPPADNEIIQTERFIDKQTAAKFTISAFERFGLFKKESLKKRLNAVQPGEPVLVKHIGRANDHYYIVPLQTQNKAVYALACIDAMSGAYRESGFARDLEGPLHFQELSHDEILHCLGEEIELTEDEQNLKIYKEEVSTYPLLVWKQCEESPSPYLPFYLVFIGEHHIYLRMDGKIFFNLTAPLPVTDGINKALHT